MKTCLKEEKPKCYSPNNDCYPLCIGDKDNGILNKVCESCNLYEDMKENFC